MNDSRDATSNQKSATSNYARVVCWGLGLLFIGAGVNHFLRPATYEAVIPSQLPAPAVLNVVAGAAEIAGGVGLLLPPTRRAASVGLLVLLVAVFPANVYMLKTGLPGYHLPQWLLWARLPVQPLLMAVVWWAGRAKRAERA